MFKIGDFSRLAQVSVRMLRHYDKLGLLTPNHTDQWTGYRYYTIDQLPRLNRIVALNGLGLTLQEIADLLGDDNALPAEQLRGMLLLRRAELERELEERRWQLASVEARLQQIEQENDPDPYEIVVKSVAPLPVAALRLTIPTVAEVGYYCNTLYGQLYRQLAAAGVAWDEPELTLYHNDEYTETDIDMEVATPVDAALVAAPPPVEHLMFRELPGHDLVAALVFEGHFEEVIGPSTTIPP
jgi:DNA-binding transcriptional MerR regulator/effector-binding domain-containing protein